MRFQGYKILLLLASCLSSIASYGQGDSTKLAISDLELLGECCIRQTGLQRDTTSLGIESRKSSTLQANYLRQITNLEKQQQNTQISNSTLVSGLAQCQLQLNREITRKNLFKVGMFTLTPIALIGGIWLGSKLGK